MNHDDDDDGEKEGWVDEPDLSFWRNSIFPSQDFRPTKAQLTSLFTLDIV